MPEMDIFLDWCPHLNDDFPGPNEGECLMSISLCKFDVVFVGYIRSSLLSNVNHCIEWKRFGEPQLC